MKRFTLVPTWSLAVCLGFTVAAGCSQAERGSGASEQASHSDEHGHGETEGHDHPSEGPHHGELIELGAEEYHAELIHDSTGATVYVLDGQAKASVPIEAAEIMINIVHDGAAEQFQLAAVPDEGDPAGKSSRFELKDAELASDLSSPTTSVKLGVTINGQAYSGSLDHHDHGDHDHGGSDHQGHDHGSEETDHGEANGA